MKYLFFLLSAFLLFSNWVVAEEKWENRGHIDEIEVKEYPICHDSVSMPFFGPEFENTVNWVRVENDLPKRNPEGGNLFGIYNTGAVYSEFKDWQNPLPPYIDMWGRKWFEQTDEDSWSVISDAGHLWELCRIDPDTTGVMQSPRFPRFNLRKNGVVLTEFVAAQATRPAIAAAWLHGEDCIVEYRFSEYNDSPETAPAVVDYHILLNGIDQKAVLGYDNGYSVNYFLGLPFFLIEKAGKRGFWFDGETTILDFDLIFHDQCCSPAMWNPYFLRAGFELYAHRNSHWYLVKGNAVIN